MPREFGDVALPQERGAGGVKIKDKEDKEDERKNFYGMHGLALLAGEILSKSGEGGESGEGGVIRDNILRRWNSLKPGLRRGTGSKPSLASEMEAFKISGPEERIKVLNAIANESSSETTYSKTGKKLAGFLASYMEIVRELGLDVLTSVGILKRELAYQHVQENMSGISSSPRRRMSSGVGMPMRPKVDIPNTISERRQRRIREAQSGGPAVTVLNGELEEFLLYKFDKFELQRKFFEIATKLEDAFESPEEIEREKGASTEFAERLAREREEHEQETRSGSNDEDE